MLTRVFPRRPRPALLATRAGSQLLDGLDQPQQPLTSEYRRLSYLVSIHGCILLGGLRTASSKPRSRWAWTTTRSAAGRAGTGTSPWPCWPMPSWSSPGPRPPPATAQRGTQPPDQPARPPPPHGARGPPAAGRPGVDHPHPAGLRAGLVTMATPPPGPRPTRTLPTTRTTSAAGVLSREVLSAHRAPPTGRSFRQRDILACKSPAQHAVVGATGFEPVTSSVSANTGNRCARRRSPRSPATVDPEGKRSVDVQGNALFPTSC